MADENRATVTQTTDSGGELPDVSTPSVDDLMAQIAAEKARADKNKAELDRALKENGVIKKTLREKQTAEEQEAEAKAEAQRIADEERESMRKELNHIKAVNAYKSISDEKSVEKLIAAVSDADHNAIAQIISDECKKAVAEAEAVWLKDRPRVQHGSGAPVTREQIIAIKDPIERQAMMAQNIELFRKQR